MCPLSLQAGEYSLTVSATLCLQVLDLFVAPNGLAVLVTATAVHVLDPTQGDLLVKHELSGHAAKVTAASLSFKGNDVVVGYADGFLKWWRLSSGEETCSTPFPFMQQGVSSPLAVHTVACSRGSGLVAAACGRCGTFPAISSWLCLNWACQSALLVTPWPPYANPAPDDLLLYSLGRIYTPCISAYGLCLYLSVQVNLHLRLGW